MSLPERSSDAETRVWVGARTGLVFVLDCKSGLAYTENRIGRLEVRGHNDKDLMAEMAMMHKKLFELEQKERDRNDRERNR